VTGSSRPDWPDPAVYPFAPHYLDVGPGRLHYLDEGGVDEGDGLPVVMVHGTPSWSFLYRHLIRDLAGHRCVAPDHLGFGLSDKPVDFSYTPRAHAENLGALIGALGLKNIVLVVHDFGGPIGLSYALEHPENVRALVVLNSWGWPNEPLARAAKLLGNPLGRTLYKRFNFSLEVLLRRAGFADWNVLTQEVLQHYRGPFPTPPSREPLWRLVDSVGETNAWLETLWARRKAIKDKPALLLWGTKDKLVPLSFLDRWQGLFPRADVLKLNAGHFVQEEAAGEIGEAVRRFLRTLEQR